MKQLIAKKSPQKFQTVDDGDLHKILSAPALIAIGIGAVIGTGIFVLTGIAAAQHAGPALVLSFLIAGLGCALAGLCYAEFAAMMPLSGSAYSYSYATLGELAAWFIGWNLILEYLVGAATVSVGWSGYVVNLLSQFHVDLPTSLVNSPFRKEPGTFLLERTGALINLPAVLIVGLITILCYVGIHHSARFNNIIVILKAAVVMLFIVFGAFYIDSANWVPFVPANTGQFGHFGWSGVAQAAGIVFYTYIGFDAVSTAAGESRNPQRDMPIGILVSLMICTILYIAVAAVLTGMVHYPLLNVPAPVALALDTHPALKWLSPWLKIGAIAGMTSVILVLILGQPRIFYAMAKDGLLPPIFAQIHARYKTPYRSTVVTGLAAAVIGGLFPVDILGEMVSIGTLMAFATVCIGILILRHTKPDLPRPFKVPAPWITCLAGGGICGGMMLALPSDTWWRLLIWTTIGALLYIFYGYRHSLLHKCSN